MAARAENKILRVGVVRGGKIVEERLLSDRSDVTLGSGPKNTFVLPASGLPKRFTLFEMKGGRYHLSFDDKMEGKVSVGDGVADLGVLKKQASTRKRGDSYRHPLTEDARGKVVIGDVTLLFQFVAPPPEVARMELPKEFKRSIIRSLDKVFTAILLVSIVAHVSSITYLYTVPLPEGYDLERVPDRFAKLIVPERPETPPPEAPGLDETKKEEEAPEEEPEPEKLERTEEEIKKAAEAEEVREAVQEQGILKIIGTRAQTGGSAFADLLERGGKTEGLDEALQRAGGVRTARAGDDMRGPGDGDRRSDIGDLATEGAGKVDRGERQETRVRGGIQQGAIEADSTTVDADQIGRFIRARQQAIQACYESELRRNPQLRGRLLVNIAIATSGRVSAVDFIEDTVGSAAVVNCVRSRIRTWVFPVRPPEETAVSVPFIFAPAG